MKLPVVGGEGPFGIILCPSRELARQTFDVVDYFCKHLHRGGFPELRTVLCIGEALEAEQRIFLQLYVSHLAQRNMILALQYELALSRMPHAALQHI